MGNIELTCKLPEDWVNKIDITLLLMISMVLTSILVFRVQWAEIDLVSPSALNLGIFYI
jgi:hypothetical protein